MACPHRAGGCQPHAAKPASTAEEPSRDQEVTP
jgi:hypothetical protein